MSQKTEFDEWWNNTYLRTTEHYAALYRVFFKLHNANADLNTLERLCGYLRLGDLLTSMFLAEKSKGKKKSLSADNIELPTMIGTLLDEFLLDHILHVSWSRGRKLDRWGSVFLALVTTYMRDVSGKPHDRLADDLLRAVRIHLGVPLSTDISRDGRNRVRDKINKLGAHIEQERYSRGERTALNRYIAAEITKPRTQGPPRIASKKKYVK